MPWKKTDSLLSRHFNRHGLNNAISAGLVCKEAERLYPELFRAISLRRGILHLEVEKKNQLALKMIEGKLIKDLAAFATEKKLPVPTRIRLTFPDYSAII